MYETLEQVMNTTRIQKGRDGWEAKTTIDMGAKNRVLIVGTYKTAGSLVTSATVHTEKDGYLSTVLFQDFSKRTVHKGVRCTEKTVKELHQLALDSVAQILAEAAAHYAKKECGTQAPAMAAEPGILEGYTAQDVLAKQEREATNTMAPKPYTPPVTADQVDLFQPQGGLFV